MRNQDLDAYIKVWQDIEAGLKSRGFSGLESIDSMGECNKDNKHYLLRTDGLIIYSNYPWAHDIISLDKDTKNKMSLYYFCWDIGCFNFKELDEIIMVVNL